MGFAGFNIQYKHKSLGVGFLSLVWGSELQNLEWSFSWLITTDCFIYTDQQSRPAFSLWFDGWKSLKHKLLDFISL